MLQCYELIACITGPTGASGEGLAGGPGKGLAAARRRPRQGPCRANVGFLGKNPAEDCCLPILI